MSRKLSPGGLFRRLFNCPSAPEVSNISDSSDEVPTQKLVTEPRGRLKKRKERDERFRSVADLQFSQEFQDNSQRLSTSENQLSGRVVFYQMQKYSSLQVTLDDTDPIFATSRVFWADPERRNCFLPERQHW